MVVVGTGLARELWCYCAKEAAFVKTIYRLFFDVFFLEFVVELGKHKTLNNIP
jgi:hypothetical protein